MTVLSLKRVSRSFGGITALSEVSLDVPPGARHVIFGPNGAGKTTLFRVTSGEIGVTSGTIELFGVDVTGAPAWKRARLGLARTFQITNLFPELTVEQCVRLAVQAPERSRRCFWRVTRAISAVERRVGEILAGEKLEDLRDVAVKELSYGDQRRLEITLAMAARPRVLLLDEPTAGLSPGDAERVIEEIAALPEGVAVVLIEHDLDVAFAVARTATVMSHGQVVTEGTVEEIRADPEVRALYLGEETLLEDRA